KFTLITNNIDLYEKVKEKKDLEIIFDENYTYKYDIKDNLLGVEQGYYYDEKTKEIKREQ
uniref:hypothetical protein n=1 Tax=uncultured Campylobacter sp. TaxID=218934 RepID=UPI00261ABA8D